MEILNRNQRRSAMWRLLFLGLIIVGLTVTAIASMHKNYSGGGGDEIAKLKKELQEREQYWKGIDQNHRNERGKSEKEIKDLKSKKEKPNERVAHLENLLELRNERIQNLNTQLANCNNN